jgi:hypothetical protein
MLHLRNGNIFGFLFLERWIFGSVLSRRNAEFMSFPFQGPAKIKLFLLKFLLLLCYFQIVLNFGFHVQSADWTDNFISQTLRMDLFLLASSCQIQRIWVVLFKLTEGLEWWLDNANLNYMAISLAKKVLNNRKFIKELKLGYRVILL